MRSGRHPAVSCMFKNNKFIKKQWQKRFGYLIYIITCIVIFRTELKSYYSIYMLTPNQMHAQDLIKMWTYKTKNSNKPKLTTVQKLYFYFY